MPYLTYNRREFYLLALAAFAALFAAPGFAAEMPTVSVKDGIVQPRRPVMAAIAHAMQFLKKADGGYKPGNIDGELAGYFTSAHVNEDGSRTTRHLAFPARQHAYFIRTFVLYGKHSGEREWLTRARDLADWNIRHSTPESAHYPNIPYSTWVNGKPGGSADRQSTEPDKAAFLGSAYILLYEQTSEKTYLAAANGIAETLAKRQNRPSQSSRGSSI